MLHRSNDVCDYALCSCSSVESGQRVAAMRRMPYINKAQFGYRDAACAIFRYLGESETRHVSHEF